MFRGMIAISLCLLLLGGCENRLQPTKRVVSEDSATGEFTDIPGHGGAPHGMAPGTPGREQAVAAEGPDVVDGTMHLTAPEGWIRKRPRSGMTLAEFSLPHAEQDTTDGRVTVTPIGGTEQMLIDYWRNQFQGNPEPDSVKKLVTAGGQVTEVRFSGTFSGARASATDPARSDYQMVGAIFTFADQQYTVKCYGPQKTMAKHEDGVQSFLQSLKTFRPESIKPKSKEPDETEPDAAEPDAAEPDETEPDETEPEATEPEATEPDETEPDETKRVVSEDSATDVVHGAMHLTAPEGWIRKQPRSGMTLAEFSLPHAKQDTTDGRVTVTSIGGTEQMLIDYWRNQFQGNPEPDSVKKLATAGGQVTEVRFSGTFSGARASATDPAPSDYRMVGAIFTLGGQQYTVKCYGPEKTMAKHEDGIQSFLQSLKTFRPESIKPKSPEPEATEPEATEPQPGESE